MQVYFKNGYYFKRGVYIGNSKIAKGCPQKGEADATDEPQDAPQEAPSNGLANLTLLIFVLRKFSKPKPPPTEEQERTQPINPRMPPKTLKAMSSQA